MRYCKTILSTLFHYIIIYFVYTLFLSPGCQEKNYAPIARMDITPTSGEMPLEVMIKDNSIDENGLEDIVSWELYVNDKSVLKSNSPLDTKRIFSESGIYNIKEKVTDSEGEYDETTPVKVEVYGKPFVAQSAFLQNDVEIKSGSILYRTANANLEVKKDGQAFFQQNVSDVAESGNDFEKVFTNSPKGKYDFKLTAGELKSETSVEIPNYKPTAAAVTPVNLLEESETTITLPTPTDKNPEDVSQIRYTKATSLDGKTRATILPENKLKIESFYNNIGAYQIKLEFGSEAGGLEELIITGNVNDDTRMRINPFVATNSNGAAFDLLTTKADRDAYVQSKLNEDWVDKMLPLSDPLWDCSEFSNQLKINFHGFPGLPGYAGNNMDSIYYYHGTLKDNGKFGLPVLNVLVSGLPGHEMNAILTGDYAENFSNWNFIEPQFDQMNVQPGQAYMPRDCELILNFTYSKENEIQGKYLSSTPLLKFKVENGVPTLIWKTSDSNLNFITQRR